MKIKTSLIVVTSCILLLGVFVGSTYASVTCSDASVVQAGVYPVAGQSDPDYIIKVECNDTAPVRFTDQRSYYLVPELGNAGYATALTAMSTGMHLKLTLSSFGSLSLCENMKLLGL